MDHARDECWPGALDEVTGALDTLTSALDGEDDFTVLMQRMCEQVTKAVPGADEAFTLLVEQSQRENLKLRDLATRFVAHTTNHDPSS
jgi:hypothetical protein